MVVSVRFQEFGLSLCLIPTEIFGHWQHWPALGSVTHWTGGFTHGGYARSMCGWKALSHAPTAGIRYYSSQSITNISVLRCSDECSNMLTIVFKCAGVVVRHCRTHSQLEK